MRLEADLFSLLRADAPHDRRERKINNVCATGGWLAR
jgi:hypothetical protein